MEKLIEIIKSVKYGTVELFIKDGNIVEVRTTEKIKVNIKPN